MRVCQLTFRQADSPDFESKRKKVIKTKEEGLRLSGLKEMG